MRFAIENEFDEVEMIYISDSEVRCVTPRRNGPGRGVSIYSPHHHHHHHITRLDSSLLRRSEPVSKKNAFCTSVEPI